MFLWQVAMTLKPQNPFEWIFKYSISLFLRYSNPNVIVIFVIHWLFEDFDEVLEVLQFVCVLNVLSFTHLIYVAQTFQHEVHANNCFQVLILHRYIFETAAQKLSYGVVLPNLQSGNRVSEVKQLDDAVGLPFVAD